MKKQEFSCHLQELTPSLKKLINSMRRTRYFGYLDASDLLQETMITLYMKVPKHYNKQKGSLKSYCLAAAKNCIRRIANRQYRYQSEIAVDWTGVYNQSHGKEDFNDTSKSVYAMAVKKTSVKPNTQKLLFKVKLDELAKINRDFEIIKVVHKHDTDRKAACKELGMSNASITKVFKRVRRYRDHLTLTANPVSEYAKNGVNAFTTPCIHNNMRTVSNNQEKPIN